MPRFRGPHAHSIRAAQVILVTLAGGVVTFTAVAISVRLASEAGPSNPRIGKLLLLVTAGLAASEVFVYAILRKQALGRLAAGRAEALELLEQGRLPSELFTLALVGAALTESVGLLGMVALLVGGPWLALVAPALAVLLILAQLPIRERVEALVRGLPGQS